MIVKSLAKINLFLYVLRKREDGYHDLYTLMHKINLFDYMEIKKVSKNGITITTNRNEINNPSNLAYKAAEMFFKISGIKPQVHIDIEKHIPLGGGLGGGSSNAAYTLKVLNEMFDFPIDDSSLKLIAAKIGSDVPFFLCKKPAALAEGRGDILTEIECDTKNLSIFLVFPQIHISTASVYSKIMLTSGKPINKMPFVAGVSKCGFQDIEPYIFNDLESVVLTEFGTLKELKKILVGFFGNALLSGSGSSIFSIINPEVRAKEEVEDFLVSKGVLFKTVNFSKEGR